MLSDLPARAPVPDGRYYCNHMRALAYILSLAILDAMRRSGRTVIKIFKPLSLLFIKFCYLSSFNTLRH